MKLLKVISFFFIIYFIRRFIQLYRTMKDLQTAQNSQHQGDRKASAQGNIINADYKVLD